VGWPVHTDFWTGIVEEEGVGGGGGLDAACVEEHQERVEDSVDVGKAGLEYRRVLAEGGRRGRGR